MCAFQAANQKHGNPDSDQHCENASVYCEPMG
jgi:hypothetical protein